MIFKNKTLDFDNNVYIMGILNITPDSFSDGGKYFNIDKALFHTEEMINQGADIIDIGGESTRPFSKTVSLDEELDRVVPIVEKINKNFNTLISIDTYKSKVAEEALKNGAEIINDISGFTFDEIMPDIAKKYDACCIIMHIKGTPENMQLNPVYDNVVKEINDFLNSKADFLRQKGINKIILDPGFGFGKKLNDNYIVLKELKKICNKYPILIGISRKSMIGKIVDSDPVNRAGGTIALNTIGILNGARIIRVHDVYENFQAAKVIMNYINSK